MLALIRGNWRKLWIILVIAIATQGISAQDLETRLAQRADFTPASGSVREQLVQVAQHYKIPMGIEWVLQPEEKHVKLVAGEASTVMALLKSILQATPDYSMTVRNGVVNVSYSRYAVDSRNFLNLRIGEFSLNNANVFDAAAELRLRFVRHYTRSDSWAGRAGDMATAFRMKMVWMSGTFHLQGRT